MSSKILVLYASTHGQTAKIAQRIGATLHDGGDDVDVVAIDDAPSDVAQYDAVICGASVHAGRHQSEIVKWIGVRSDALDAMPSAFFSVSLSAADETDEARADTRKMVDDVLNETGWTPVRTEAIAGALQFSKYNLPTRVLMRLIVRRHDPKPDLHADTEYTDWDAVDRFAREFAASAAKAPTAS